jgi:hypothetical protein
MGFCGCSWGYRESGGWICRLMVSREGTSISQSYYYMRKEGKKLTMVMVSEYERRLTQTDNYTQRKTTFPKLAR